ncbi:MAG TPA: tripartite tricarboxylate transporter substrate-binding protein, partial [Bryobacteraceae bacterium]|nr:tripartite tricarboxylate transporter substrate-binding protein [Bryobacteraceae bacterium]
MPAGVATITDFAELHRAGKIRMLAIGGNVRAEGLSDVPTFREAGYDTDGTTWIGLHAPAGVPRATFDRLASAIGGAMREPEIRARFLKLGFDPTGTTPRQFEKIIRDDRAKWEPIIRASGFKQD